MRSVPLRNASRFWSRRLHPIARSLPNSQVTHGHWSCHLCSRWDHCDRVCARCVHPAQRYADHSGLWSRAKLCPSCRTPPLLLRHVCADREANFVHLRRSTIPDRSLLQVTWSRSILTLNKIGKWWKNKKVDDAKYEHFSLRAAAV